MTGPFRLHAHPAPAGWTLVSEELLQPDGSTRWDVYLRHTSGVRVPRGPNLHADPTAEEERLGRAVGAR